MPRPKHVVKLTSEEREQLLDLVRSGSHSAHIQRHARILLKADSSEGGPACNDDAIASAVEVSRPTIERVRRAFAMLRSNGSSGVDRHAASLMVCKKHSLPHLLVRQLPKEPSVGRSTYWPISWLNCALSSRLPLTPCVLYSKKRTQAVVEARVEDSAQGQCGLCGPDGRCPGSLRLSA